ncbi:MAG: hypothetical protein ACI9EH_000319, partial [Planktomarina sp.]
EFIPRLTHRNWGWDNSCSERCFGAAMIRII